MGFHFFYPASVMRLIEVVEGEQTSEETMQATSNFAQRIRKMPIRCGETPGFVVNRILNSAASEIWRYKDESGRRRRTSTRRSPTRRSPDGAVLSPTCSVSTRCCTSPSTCRSHTGERFYVSPEMRELVEAGNLGQKSGKGFYEHGSG